MAERSIGSKRTRRNKAKESRRSRRFLIWMGLCAEAFAGEEVFFDASVHRLIGFRNYFWWIGEAVRLAPRGISQIMHANKMYLRGVRVDECGSAVLPAIFP